MYNKILIATDLSPRSKNALKKGIKFAHYFNSELIQFKSKKSIDIVDNFISHLFKITI